MENRGELQLVLKHKEKHPFNPKGMILIWTNSCTIPSCVFWKPKTWHEWIKINKNEAKLQSTSISVHPVPRVLASIGYWGEGGGEFIGKLIHSVANQRASFQCYKGVHFDLNHGDFNDDSESVFYDHLLYKYQIMGIEEPLFLCIFVDIF